LPALYRDRRFRRCYGPAVVTLTVLNNGQRVFYFLGYILRYAIIPAGRVLGDQRPVICRRKEVRLRYRIGDDRRSDRIEVDGGIHNAAEFAVGLSYATADGMAVAQVLTEADEFSRLELGVDPVVHPFPFGYGTGYLPL